MIINLLKSFIRSWQQHTGMQFATLVIMTASFAVSSLVLCVFLNLNHILTLWGESIHLTVYLAQEAKPESVASIESFLKSQTDLAEIKFLSKELSLKTFKEQMETYAPGLFDDPMLGDAIPDSFQAALSPLVALEKQTQILSVLSQQISNLDGVEDVSYGQEWVTNYSKFMATIQVLSVAVVLVLLLAGCFVIGNAIRLGIAQRRDEIEIMELVGASASMIRLPFLVEGAILGFLSAILGLLISFGLFYLGVHLISTKLAFLRLAHEIKFLGSAVIVLLLIMGIVIGLLGAYVCVFRINDGWAAAKRTNA